MEQKTGQIKLSAPPEENEASQGPPDLTTVSYINIESKPSEIVYLQSSIGSWIPWIN